MKPLGRTAARVAALSALFLSLLLAPVGGYVIADEDSLRSQEFEEFLQSEEFQELLQSEAFKEFIRSFEFMSVGEVCERWGDGPLDVAAFRAAEGDEAARAAMACSLLKNEDDYAGMPVSEIRRLFGAFEGHFWSEAQPTYLIEIAETKAEDSWQIVFLHDRDRRVTRIVVHKNCCGDIDLDLENDPTGRGHSQ